MLSRFLSVDFKYSNPDRLSTNEFISLVSNPQNLASYAYARNNPVRWKDSTGLEPGDAFSTADDAAVDALKRANYVSIMVNTEFGGWIYEKSGKFYATFPTKGKSSGTQWNDPAPTGLKVVGNTTSWRLLGRTNSRRSGQSWAENGYSGRSNK